MTASIDNFHLPDSFSKTANLISLGHAQEFSIDATSEKMYVEIYVVTHNNKHTDTLVKCCMNTHLVNNPKTRESLHYYIKSVTGVGNASMQMYTFRTSSKDDYEKMKDKFLNAVSIIENMPVLILRKLDLHEFIPDPCDIKRY